VQVIIDGRTIRTLRPGEVANVAATIQEGVSDRLPLALIGMSFLKQVEMRRVGNTMTLSRPHLQ
jgi:predicted aspartyl protease